MIRHLVVCSFVLGSLAVSTCALASEECSEIHRGRVSNPEGNQIRVVPESAGAAIEHEAIEGALAMWTRTCASSAPRFGSQGHIVMRVRFHDGPNDLPDCGDGCGCTISNTRYTLDGGEYLASAITHLFEYHRDGRGACRSHRRETLAHEVGHVLGFRHPDDPYSSECSGLIMSFSRNRLVRASDCRALADLWTGEAESVESELSYTPMRKSASAEAEERLKEPGGGLKEPWGGLKEPWGD